MHERLYGKRLAPFFLSGFSEQDSPLLVLLSASSKFEYFQNKQKNPGENWGTNSEILRCLFLITIVISLRESTLFCLCVLRRKKCSLRLFTILNHRDELLFGYFFIMKMRNAFTFGVNAWASRCTFISFTFIKITRWVLLYAPAI